MAWFDYDRQQHLPQGLPFKSPRTLLAGCDHSPGHPWGILSMLPTAGVMLSWVAEPLCRRLHQR